MVPPTAGVSPASGPAHTSFTAAVAAAPATGGAAAPQPRSHNNVCKEPPEMWAWPWPDTLPSITAAALTCTPTCTQMLPDGCIHLIPPSAGSCDQSVPAGHLHMGIRGCRRRPGPDPDQDQTETQRPDRDPKTRPRLEDQRSLSRSGDPPMMPNSDRITAAPKRSGRNLHHYHHHHRLSFGLSDV